MIETFLCFLFDLQKLRLAKWIVHFQQRAKKNVLLFLSVYLIINKENLHTHICVTQKHEWTNNQTIRIFFMRHRNFSPLFIPIQDEFQWIDVYFVINKQNFWLFFFVWCTSVKESATCQHYIYKIYIFHLLMGYTALVTKYHSIR